MPKELKAVLRDGENALSQGNWREALPHYEALNAQPEADFLYSDEDRLDDADQRVDPHFKPDWSPDTLRSHNYVGRLALYRRDLIGARLDRAGVTDYDLALRAGEQAKRIVHVPHVLYHARQRPQPVASEADRVVRLVDGTIVDG